MTSSEFDAVCADVLFHGIGGSIRTPEGVLVITQRGIALEFRLDGRLITRAQAEALVTS